MENEQQATTSKATQPTSTEQKKDHPKCMTTSCDSKSDVFCLICNQLFCTNHNDEHQRLLRTPHNTISADRHSAKIKGDDNTMCREHNQPFILACENCYMQACSTCFDDMQTGTNNVCWTYGYESGYHNLRSSGHVKKTVRTALQDKLSEFRVHEFAVRDTLERKRKRVDEQLETSRDDLDRLDARIEQWKCQVSQVGERLRADLTNHMNRKKAHLDLNEEQFSTFTSQCRGVHEKSGEVLEIDEDIVKKYAHAHSVDQMLDVKRDAERLMEFQLTHYPNLEKRLVLEDEAFKPPMKLETTGSYVPGNLVCQNTTDTDQSSFAVLYLAGEQQVMSGGVKLKTGLSYIDDDSWSNVKGWSTYSLAQHGSSLYVLQWSLKPRHKKGKYRIYVIDLLKKKIRNSVVEVYGSGYITDSLAVNNRYLVFSSYHSRVVHVYSIDTYCFLYNMSFETGRPSGAAFLNDDLVVGDIKFNSVSRVTMSMNPTTRWRCPKIQRSSGLVIWDEAGLILAGSDLSIFMLSLEGLKLRKFKLFLCNGRLCDISVDIDRSLLAVADEAGRVVEYRMIDMAESREEARSSDEDINVESEVAYTLVEPSTVGTVQQSTSVELGKLYTSQ